MISTLPLFHNSVVMSLHNVQAMYINDQKLKDDLIIYAHKR